MKKNLSIFAFIVIFVASFWLRFNNLNWDSNSHLHPDERFLTMVVDSMQVPTSFGEYLDPKVSKFNPNNNGQTFFVYGTLPLFIVKYIAIVVDQNLYGAQMSDGVWISKVINTYGGITTLGRGVSAAFDMITVILVFACVWALEKKFRFHPHIKLWAMFAYGVMVLPIQLGHYLATDSFLNTFMFASFFCCIMFVLHLKEINIKAVVTSKNILWLIGSAIFAGFSISSKINGFFIIPLCGALVALGLIQSTSLWPFKHAVVLKKITQIIPIGIILGLVYIVAVYFATRLTDPYLFETGNLFDFTISKNYIAAIENLQNLNKKEAWFPPGVQWINNPPVIYALRDIVIWGCGVFIFVLSLVGIGSLLASFKKNRILGVGFVVTLLWIIACFLYQGVQFTKAMRYFIYLYPFLAVFAGFGMMATLKLVTKLPKLICSVAVFVLALLFIGYTAAFQSIYFRPHSRIEASRWIFFNLPSGTQFANEHWDDGLPIPLPENPGKSYPPGLELPVFGDDKDPTKWPKMDAALAQADYYILSSNRAWGSVVTVPERFPKQTQFYADLFAGKTQYKLEKKFTSFPGFDLPWGGRLEIDDRFSDETFTVYDHPIVMIYKNTNPQKPEATTSAKTEEKK